MIVDRHMSAILAGGGGDDATSTTTTTTTGGPSSLLLVASSPSPLADWTMMGHHYEVRPPDAGVVLGMAAGIFAQLLFGLAFAAMVYHGTLSPRGSRSRSSGSGSGGSSGNNGEGGGGGGSGDGDGDGRTTTNRITTRLAIFTTTLVVASSILLPYALISSLAIENSASRFAVCSSFVLYLFRTLEAHFGFVPPGAARSFRTYAAYFALPFDMSFDADTDEPIMATGDDIRTGRVRAMSDVATIILLCSILSPFDYAPFGSLSGDRADQLGLLHWRHLGDCLVIAFFFQQGLSVSFSIFGNAIQSTLGYRCNPMMKSPILEATSPSDFWGRRWNVLVHAVMKRGLYKPARRRTNSPLAASLAVFVASGVFHEWLVHACFLYGKQHDDYNHHHRDHHGVVRIGSQSAFFVWNFGVVAMERVILDKRRFEKIANFGRRVVPGWIVPPLIVMTSLPVAHWFRDPYMNGGFFSDYESCFPMIIRKVVAKVAAR